MRDADQQRKGKRKAAARKPARAKGAPPEEQKEQEGLDLLLETVKDLLEERSGEEEVWGSMVKHALKRRKPGFNESDHGFRTFGKLLEEAQARNLLDVEWDERSGGYIIKGLALQE